MSERRPVREPTAADPDLGVELGLCARCRYRTFLRSRTSWYLRCARSDQDEALARYPALPVRSCRGFSTDC